MEIKHTVKEFLRKFACKTFLAPKSFDSPPEGIKTIDCQWQQVTPLLNTSNNVFRIKFDEKLLYFRECKIHKEIHAYVADDIDFYYSFLRPDLQEDRLFVEKKLINKRNFKLFINMGMTNDTTSGAYHFCMGDGGVYIGLEGASPHQEERLKDFIQYIWGNLFVYSLNSGVKTGHYQTYNACRSIAFRYMAELLKVDNLIPPTEYVWLRIDGVGTFFGSVMEQASGECMDDEDNKRRKEVCSPALQRSLGQLNLLDVLCQEKDHRIDNYNVVLDSGYASSVVAFDNDSPASFGIGGISFATYVGCSPWAYGKKLNRPYVDRGLADAIMQIDDKRLHQSMKGLLNFFQIAALRKRIKKVKTVLASAEDTVLLSEGQWNKDTINKELSGEYGETYFSKFVKEHKLMAQPWIKGLQ